MVKRIIKILAALAVVVVLAVPAVALLVGDETLSSVLERTPGLSDYKDQILQAKQGISMTLSGYVGDSLSGLESLSSDLFGPAKFGSTPRVVIDLPPAARQGASSPPAAPPPPPSRETAKAPTVPETGGEAAFPSSSSPKTPPPPGAVTAGE